MRASAPIPIGIVVLQTDFGLKDQAVAAMRGVIRTVDRRLTVDDLTHEIPSYNIWEAAYRFNAVIDYWPAERYSYPSSIPESARRASRSSRG